MGHIIKFVGYVLLFLVVFCLLVIAIAWLSERITFLVTSDFISALRIQQQVEFYGYIFLIVLQLVAVLLVWLRGLSNFIVRIAFTTAVGIFLITSYLVIFECFFGCLGFD